VEAIDEFETKSDQERNEKQQKWQIVADPGASRVDISINTVGDKQNSRRETAEK
jgi:hypothetical protein